ncbi:MAG: global cell cycle regulator GcrA-like protein [Alphaproteobacteria bacterium]|nr:global cell cycle regulator GcrA-like protein [Alphaproteobacteria bacterium]
MGKRVWTDETREQVRTLFTQGGLSYGQISQRLGMSRDVVAGLVNRMNLTGLGRNPAHGGHKKRKLAVEPHEAPFKTASDSLIDLGRACCAWPIGDPKGADFRFCGTPTDGRSPYCLAHREKAYTASEPRRERTAEERRDRRVPWAA